MIKKGFLIFVICLLFTVKVQGNFDDTQNSQDPRLYFFQNYNLEDDREGISIFLLSNVTYSGTRKGDIYLLFSNIEIKSEVTGDIYSFFSNVNVGLTGVISQMETLSSTVTYLEKSNVFKISPIIEPLDFLVRISEDEGYVIYNDRIPNFIIIGFLIFFKVFICLTFLALRKGLFLQGAMTVFYDKEDIFKNGIMAYIIFWILIIVFLLSALGVPISFLIAIVFYACIAGGQVSFGVFLGNAILSNTNRRFSIGTKLVLGVALLEALSLIPYIRYIMKFFIYPILYTGIFFTAVANVYVKKIFYNIPFISENIPQYYNSERIKSIIMKDIE